MGINCLNGQTIKKNASGFFTTRHAIIIILGHQQVTSYLRSMFEVHTMEKHEKTAKQETLNIEINIIPKAGMLEFKFVCTAHQQVTKCLQTKFEMAEEVK